MTGSTPRPLLGTTVLDLSRMLPGAVLARMLIDLGARVIKVEQPSSGDPMRRVPPLVGGVGAAFCAFYRGAESFGLDLKHEGGTGTLLRLVEHADVLVESFRPGTLAGWGVGPEALLAANPALVGCSLSGFGIEKEASGLPVHDVNVAAWSGLLSLLPGEGLPHVQIPDVVGGLLACSAVLAALLQRAGSGRGCWLDQPLASAPLPFLTLPMADSAAGGGGAAHLLSGACPCYRLYTCGDGLRIALGALEPKFWVAFVDLLGLSELAGVGFDAGPGGKHAAALVEEALGSRPREEWLALAAERGLPVTAVRTVGEAVQDLRDSGFMEQTPAPAGGTLELPGPYLRSLGAPPSRPAPRLGEHTETILAGLE